VLDARLRRGVNDYLSHIKFCGAGSVLPYAIIRVEIDECSPNILECGKHLITDEAISFENLGT